MKPWHWHALVLSLIALFSVSPLIPVFVAGAVAEANGCTLNEGGVNPCVVNGRDYGPTLYSMFVLGWLALATVPLGGMAFTLYAGVALAVWLLGRRKGEAKRG